MTYAHCSIVPPTLLVSLLEADDENVRASARRSLDYERALLAR